MAAIAPGMNLDRITRNEGNTSSVYDDRGILFFKRNKKQKKISQNISDILRISDMRVSQKYDL